jgi:predicted O-methyltransferase YrrM
MYTLLSLLPRRPREFYERIAAMIDAYLEAHWHKQPEYKTVDWTAAVKCLSELLGDSLEDCLREDALYEIEQQVRQGIGAMPPDAPFASFHNGDFKLGRLCYALTRIRRPTAIVETGVCYGVTSSFMLKALEVNGKGRLHSIDLPPLGANADDFVGQLVPESLRGNWRLHRGSSRRLMPQILRSEGQIDFFLHDSLHTHRNMRYELELVRSHLSTDAVVVADDVEGNSAFQDWILSTSPAYAGVLREEAKRKSLLGVAVFCSQAPISGAVRNTTSPHQEIGTR